IFTRLDGVGMLAKDEQCHGYYLKTSRAIKSFVKVRAHLPEAVIDKSVAGRGMNHDTTGMDEFGDGAQAGGSVEYMFERATVINQVEAPPDFLRKVRIVEIPDNICSFIVRDVQSGDLRKAKMFEKAGGSIELRFGGLAVCGVVAYLIMV